MKYLKSQSKQMRLQTLLELTNCHMHTKAKRVCTCLHAASACLRHCPEEEEYTQPKQCKKLRKCSVRRKKCFTTKQYTHSRTMSFVVFEYLPVNIHKRENYRCLNQLDTGPCLVKNQFQYRRVVTLPHEFPIVVRAYYMCSCYQSPYTILGYCVSCLLRNTHPPMCTHIQNFKHRW